MNPPTVYLVGGIYGRTWDEYGPWREHASRHLRHAGFHVINPVLWERVPNLENMPKVITAASELAVSRSDILLVEVSPTGSWGSTAETVRGKREYSTLNVGWGLDLATLPERYPWIEEFIDHCFVELDDAIDLIIALYGPQNEEPL